MKYIRLTLLGILLLLDSSCGSPKVIPHTSTEPLVVYKTRKDYRNQISVQLSADGKTIVAFPAPEDVLSQKPIELADGYFLKRMPGDAFLSLTIEDYANSSRNYTADDLLALVVDRNPYVEIFDCAGCVTADTSSINILIREGKLNQCKKLH